MKYETLHQVIKSVQSNYPFFIRMENGKVETRFLVAPLEKKDMTVFPTQIAMLQPVTYVWEDGLKINAFCEYGKQAMKANHPLAIYGEIFVIVLNVEKKKLLRKIIQEEFTQQILKERYEVGNPKVDLLELYGKFDYYVL